MNISAWAIRNPIPSILLFVLLTFAGLIAFRSLGVNQFPDIDIPTVTVGVAQTGAAPAELETQVTRLVENAVAGVGNVSHIRSTVGDGISTTSIEFAIGTDTDRAVNDVRDAITKIRQDLPAEVQEPTIQRQTSSGGAIMTFSVSSDTLDAVDLSWFVDNDVAKALLSVPGVSNVNRTGGVDREVRIELIPERLMAYGVTAAEVSRQLGLVNIDLPGGRANIGSSEQSIRTLGSAGSVDQLRELRIALADGRRIRLADLGAVSDGAAEARQAAYLNGKPVVAFGVLRAVGSSAVSVAKGVEEALEALRAEHPNVKIELISNTVKFVEATYEGSMDALYEGVVLAIIVVWLFLRDWRATAIAATAMPLSIIPTFAIMVLAGFTLNNITLLAITLTVGILVDDAIVEIENIVRHIRMGKTPYQAAIEAADEIGLAVVATTLTIVAVFLPVSFMSGIPGQFFQPFGLTVAAAVVLSLVVARLITPMIAAYFLTGHDAGPARPSAVMTQYLRVVAWALSHRKLTMATSVVVMALSVFVATQVPTGFIPASDRSQTTLNLELAPGATLAQTTTMAERARQIIARRPEVTGVYAAVGAGSSAAGPGGDSTSGDVRKATLTVNMVPKGERKFSQQELESLMTAALADLPGVRYRFSSGNAGETVSIVLASDDGRKLQDTAERVQREMTALPEVANAFSTSALRRPEIVIRPDLDRAAQLGVSVSDIAATARIATIGDVDANLAKFNLTDRQIPIRMQIPESQRGSIDTIGLLGVPSASGPVPLNSVAAITLDSGPAQITRFDRFRSVTIDAEAKVPLGDVTKALAKLPTLKKLPDGVFEIKYGDTERMGQVFAQFAIAIATGVFLMYAVLVLLFGDFMQPLTIMAALPLALGGAFGMLYVTGEALTLPATIGFLMLMGIVAKNSILLVEYGIISMHRGMARTEALIDACAKRATPIVMTTIAMAAGMLPTALRLGEDADFRAGMAIAVIGGLMSSTLLSLIYIPVIYSYVDDVSKWLGKRLSKLSTYSGTPVGADDPT
ncbi:MAG: efflux RND transporter permease subunit [Alphaproteobacteria bacterium]|jgi:multidrug efflux pump subunit AcrB|nr:efflux RND transporter permease subunit [Alphaproteobacteria bacterium]